MGFQSDGKTLAWSPKNYSKEYPTWPIPCGKCISCRLENARQTAVRCVHESKMHEQNSFITLTYSEENLKSPKLQYQDFQTFIKALRTSRFNDLLNTLFPSIQDQKTQRRLYNQLTKERRNELYETIKISVYVAGEYGDQLKRPHWHALIFNWWPPDSKYLRTNERGDRIYKSELLDTLWGKNDPIKKPNEIGDVNIHSAGYCARYAAKKLAHGKDGTHNYEPVSRRSCKNAIGKRWIEKYWKDCFTEGYLTIENKGQYIKCGIPRYYEKWLKKHKNAEWIHYVTQIKPKVVAAATEKEEQTCNEEKLTRLKRDARQSLLQMKAGKYLAFKPLITRDSARNQILEQKFPILKRQKI